jgi:hypothetical protein
MALIEPRRNLILNPHKPPKRLLKNGFFVILNEVKDLEFII